MEDGPQTGGPGTRVEVIVMSVGTPHGMEEQTLGDVDLVTAELLRELVDVEGPCVSLFLPTSRFGPGTLSGPARLRHLEDQADADLRAAECDDPSIERLLAPVRALHGNDDFWQHQGDGLALFAAPGFFAHLRLPTALPEQAVVGDDFRVAPLVPLVSADGGFFILALAQNSVRLFHATKQGFGELALGAIPGSMQEAIPQEEAERHGQSHSTGATRVQFHGQGSEADYDKAALERYFRAVDRPLTARLGGRGEPLVLAAVRYYLPIYTAVSHYPQVWGEAVDGNPEQRSPRELHDAAWSLLAQHFVERERHYLDRYRQAAGTGLTLSGAEPLLAAARKGRVDILLLDVGTAQGGGDDLTDAAVAETLRHNGRVVAVGDLTEVEGAPVALLRY